MDDVIVAGAGPAGALAGLILARTGVRVRMFDRATFPRDKLCGDTLNPGALAVLARHLPLDPLERTALPIDGMLLTGPGGVAVRGGYPEGIRGRALLRRDLDRWLVDAAVESGVTLHDRSTILGALGSDDVRGVRVRMPGGRETSCAATITIAADGRRSRLAFAAGLARHPPHPRRWAMGTYFENVSELGTFGEMHVRPGGYIGIAPVPGGAANVCVVTPQGAAVDWRQPSAVVRRTIESDPRLAPRFARAQQVAPVSVLGPLAVEAQAAGAPGLLLAGDAAGFIDPMTGDGLRFALEGAELAAAVCLDVLSGRLSRSAAAAELARRRRARFAAKWRFNRAVRALVSSPTGVVAAAAAARILPAAFARLVRYAADLP